MNVRSLVPAAPKPPYRLRPAQAEEPQGGSAPITDILPSKSAAREQTSAKATRDHSVDRKDDFAEGLSALHAAMGGGGLGEGEGAINHRLQLRLHKGIQPTIAKARGHCDFNGLRPGFRNGADDPEMAVEQDVERQLGVVTTAEEADLDKPSALGQCPHIPVQIGRPDKVDDDIDTTARRGVSDGLAEVLPTIPERPDLAV